MDLFNLSSTVEVEKMTKEYLSRFRSQLSPRRVGSADSMVSDATKTNFATPLPQQQTRLVGLLTARQSLTYMLVSRRYPLQQRSIDRCELLAILLE